MNRDECLCKFKEVDHWVSCKNDYIRNPSTCYCKIAAHLDTKKCLCKKGLFGKLVLVCEDELLNTSETLINNKKMKNM